MYNDSKLKKKYIEKIAQRMSFKNNEIVLILDIYIYVLTYAGLNQTHRQILIYIVDKRNLRFYYQFWPVFLWLHQLPQQHCIQDQYLLKSIIILT